VRSEKSGDGVRDIHERAFAFACDIVRLHQDLFAQGGTGRVLASQVLRSGTAVGANLEEGRAGQSRPDFIAKYNIALKEARETHYWLRLLASCGIVHDKRVTPLITEANELVAILTASVKSARGHG
jgi:four helix bundle protein